jgi:hypothetical protein
MRVAEKRFAALYSCLASLVCDYVAKQKVEGSSLKYFVFKQLTVPSLSFFLRRDLFRHVTGHAPNYFLDRLPGVLTSRSIDDRSDRQVAG